MVRPHSAEQSGTTPSLARPDAPQGTAGFLDCHSTLLAYIQLAVNQKPQIPFCRTAHPGLHNPRCKIQHLLLLNFMWLAITQQSDLSRSFCKALHPQGSQQLLPVSIVCKLTVTSSPVSKWLMETLNRIGPNMEPCGSPHQ